MADAAWHDILSEFYGVKLDKRRAVIWLQEMREEDALGRVTEEELCSTLRWVRKQREGEERRRIPTLEMVIGWVKWYRKEMAASRRGYSHQDDVVGAVKAEMLKAGDHETRWNILCDPCSAGLLRSFERSTTDHECAELDDWAAARWPDWRAATARIKAEAGKCLVAAVKSVGKDKAGRA